MRILILTILMPIMVLAQRDVQFSVDTSGNKDTTVTISDSTESIDTAGTTEMASPTNLTELNSIESDFAPFISTDGRTIYFSSSRDGGFGGEDIYISHFEKGYWTNPDNLGSSVNTKYNEGAMCISPDGEDMFISVCGRPDSYGGCDIYVCHRHGENWSEPNNLGKSVNSQDWDGHPSLSPSGDTLYFASSRFGGFGGIDIYYTYKTKKGWCKPKNFGYPINNARDQTSPFLHIDGETMYFSSGGHGGLGGLDVFFTRRDTATGRWSKPQNIGPPVNTSGNDYFFSVPGAGDYIYFASDRPAGYGGFDIYSYPLEAWQRPQIVATLIGKVVDAQTGKPLAATVTIERLSDGKVIQKLDTDSLTGQFFAVLAAGQTYGISVSAPGYAFSSENYEVEMQEGYNELRHTFELRKVELGSIVSLVNLFFDFGKSDLRPESEPELMRIYNLMLEYPKMKIEVQGFADSVGNSKFNMYLSRMRAKSVRDWLVGRSIDSTRARYIGYGEEEQGATEDELQRSRRVQFKIIYLGPNIPIPEKESEPQKIPKQVPKIEQDDAEDTIPPSEPDSEDTIRSEPKIDLSALSDTSMTLDEYKSLLDNIELDNIADSLFSKYIVNGDEFKLGELESRPVAVKTAALGYPQIARDKGIEGVVLLEFKIDTMGNVEPRSAKIVKAIPPNVFDGVAIEAIYHWKYRPAIADGKKVETNWLQALIFREK
ncbi:TonB family protein [bacterium]|nr:TonB family protein [bacterium]